MERATNTEVYGCGSTQSTDITLNVQTTTGGNFSISVNGKNTVEHLKKVVSKKLKVSKDRICLLHRERQLRDGTLEENGLLDGSRVILLPSVETGLLSQRPENSVMQALESLNDTQVNDFLSGKSPLNLTMRLGDHMMLIQLQLSTLNSSRSLRNASKAAARAKREKESQNLQKTPEKSVNNEAFIDSVKVKQEKQTQVLQKQYLEMFQNAFDLYRTMAEEKYAEKSETVEGKEDVEDKTNCTQSDISDTSVESEQSPIKSLSNLVSNPIDASTSDREAAIVKSVKNSLIDLLSKNKLNNDLKPSTSSSSDKPCPSTSSPTPDSSLSDDSDNFTDQSSFLAESTIDEYPMENLFNSAVDKGLFEDQEESMMDREISNLATTSHGTQESAGTLPSFQSLNEPLKTKRFQYLLHKTSKFKHPIGQNKQKAFMQSVVNKHKKRMQIRQDSNLAQPSTSRTEPFITNSRKLILQPSSTDDLAIPSTSKQDPLPILHSSVNEDHPMDEGSSPVIPTPTINTRALIEASKNLTQKLKKLSKEVLTNKIDLKAAEEVVRTKIGPGAVIESMKHHGKGIYSGTFSGTLNPALQDRHGRPKRDISTIIHILNDLLCAAPPMALPPKEPKHSCTAEEQRKCACSSQSCSYGQSPGTGPCNKCDNAKTLALDNSKTKCKLEQLRLVMQQKKQRREARKLKTLPYTPTKTIATPDPPPTIKEEIETVA